MTICDNFISDNIWVSSESHRLGNGQEGLVAFQRSRWNLNGATFLRWSCLRLSWYLHFVDRLYTYMICIYIYMICINVYIYNYIHIIYAIYVYIGPNNAKFETHLLPWSGHGLGMGSGGSCRPWYRASLSRSARCWSVVALGNSPPRWKNGENVGKNDHLELKITQRTHWRLAMLCHLALKWLFMLFPPTTPCLFCVSVLFPGPK